jgi:hypothetical protein
VAQQQQQQHIYQPVAKPPHQPPILREDSGYYSIPPTPNTTAQQPAAQPYSAQQQQQQQPYNPAQYQAQVSSYNPAQHQIPVSVQSTGQSMLTPQSTGPQYQYQDPNQSRRHSTYSSISGAVSPMSPHPPPAYFAPPPSITPNPVSKHNLPQGGGPPPPQTQQYNQYQPTPAVQNQNMGTQGWQWGAPGAVPQQQMLPGMGGYGQTHQQVQQNIHQQQEQVNYGPPPAVPQVWR